MLNDDGKLEGDIPADDEATFSGQVLSILLENAEIMDW